MGLAHVTASILYFEVIDEFSCYYTHCLEHVCRSVRLFARRVILKPPLLFDSVMFIFLTGDSIYIEFPIFDSVIGSCFFFALYLLYIDIT